MSDDFKKMSTYELALHISTQTSGDEDGVGAWDDPAVAMRLAELVLAEKRRVPEHPKYDEDGEQIALADGTPWHPHYEGAIMFANFTVTPVPGNDNRWTVHFDTHGVGRVAGTILRTADGMFNGETTGTNGSQIAPALDLDMALFRVMALFTPYRGV